MLERGESYRLPLSQAIKNTRDWNRTSTKGRFPRRLQFRELVSTRACAFLTDPNSDQDQPSREPPATGQSSTFVIAPSWSYPTPMMSMYRSSLRRSRATVIRRPPPSEIIIHFRIGRIRLFTILVHSFRLALIWPGPSHNEHTEDRSFSGSHATKFLDVVINRVCRTR